MRKCHLIKSISLALAMMGFAIPFPSSASPSSPLYLKINPNPCAAITDNKKNRECWDIVRNKQPIFVFIPGVLGSKLFDGSGDVVWGTATANVKALDFTKHPEEYRSETLGRFEILSGIYDRDIYGKLIQEIRSRNTSRTTNFLDFSYDWRQDNRYSAEIFEKWINSDEVRSQISKRSIVIIAHSMGGLIYRYWYEKHYKEQNSSYAFSNISKSIFVGVPHYGTPQALFRIVESKPFDGFESFMLSLLGDVPRDLDKVGYSFPSLYQLLPTQRLQSVQLQSDEIQFGLSGIDIHNMRSWLDLDLLSNVAKSSGVSIVNLCKHIRPLLENARQFHDEMRACHHVKDSIHVYSNDLTTIHGGTAIVSPSGTAREFVSEECSKGTRDLQLGFNVVFSWNKVTQGGDGTVPGEVAQCSRSISDDFRKAGSGDHTEIVASDRMLSVIRDIRQTAFHKANEEISEKILGDIELLEDFSRSGTLIAMPLIVDNLSLEQPNFIRSANLEILKDIRRRGFRPTFKAPNDLPEEQKIEFDTAIVNFSLDEEQVAKSSQYLAHHLHREGLKKQSTDRKNSIRILEAGKFYSDKAVTYHFSKDFEALARNTRGALRYLLGESSEAKVDFLESNNLGYSKAAENLKRLYGGPESMI